MKPPAFAVFYPSTQNLDIDLSTLLGRYKINADGLDKRHSLEILIARTHAIINCDTDRQDQRAVFVDLVAELDKLKNSSDPNDREKKNQATLFLLGAIIYRYLRLIDAYHMPKTEKVSSWIPYLNRLYTPNPNNSELFKAVRIALNLNPKIEKNFLDYDTHTLDVVTIVDALNEFKKNMMVELKPNEPRYKNYKDFQQEGFIEKLDACIEKFTPLAAPIATQFKAIQFLQTCAKQLETEHHLMNLAIDKYRASLTKDFPDFSKLKVEDIEKHITENVDKDNPDSKTRNKMITLLKTERFNGRLSKMKPDSFIDELVKCSLSFNSYILSGAYAVVWQSPEIKELRPYLLNALGLTLATQSELTPKFLNSAMNHFKTFLRNNKETNIDFQFFGDRGKFDTQLEKLLNSTETAIAADAEEKPKAGMGV